MPALSAVETRRAPEGTLSDCRMLTRKGQVRNGIIPAFFTGESSQSPHGAGRDTFPPSAQARRKGGLSGKTSRTQVI